MTPTTFLFSSAPEMHLEKNLTKISIFFYFTSESQPYKYETISTSEGSIQQGREERNGKKDSANKTCGGVYACD